MKKKQVNKINLDKEVKNIGIALIILGVLHIVFSGFLDFTWGLVLIPVGIIALFYRSRRMLLTLGILLILVGILNLLASISEGASTFWGVFGIVQIVWGIQEINRFRKTEENPKYDIKEKRKKDFVWYGLRVGFFIMIGFWFLNVIFFDLFLFTEETTFFWVFYIFWTISIIFTFILSIIHLTRYKQKIFTIISLVLASYLILTLMIGLIFASYELLEESAYDYMPEDIEASCSNYCYELNGATHYLIEYDYDNEDYICFCTDKDANIVEQNLFQNLPELESTQTTQQTQNQHICSYNAYNCDDLPTKAEAQYVFELCGGVSNDVHHLDEDGDGLACEWNS